MVYFRMLNVFYKRKRNKKYLNLKFGMEPKLSHNKNSLSRKRD